MQKQKTRACHVVEITTPKKFRLLGLWWGPRRPKRAIVFVHGLGGSIFSMRDLTSRLIDSHTAVLAFNNRGAETISKLRHINPGRRMYAGMAHEVFTDCVDDIEGAIHFARRQQVKNVFLAGHSTGSQKSVYWASKNKGKGVKGIILLAPISDYSSSLKAKGLPRLARAQKAAQALIQRGNRHALLPTNVWQDPIDAQRFLSLYSGTSAEEVFPYAQRNKQPGRLRSIQKPVLVFLAEKDEHGDMRAKNIAAWFALHLRNNKGVHVVANTNHGFKGKEQLVAREILHFITE